MNRTKQAWTNLLFFVMTLIINTLGATGWINGITQKDISDRFLTLITPAPSTFSIWSVIYSLLLASLIVMIIKKEDPYYQNALEQISRLFMISCVLNMLWIITFSFVLIEISVIFITGFVVVLTLICGKLLEIRQGKHWLLPMCFGLYAGWLFIATVVNIAAALVKLQWTGWGITPQNWGIIMLLAAMILVAGVILLIRNAVFPLSIAWAYLGINRFLTSSEGFQGAYPALQMIAMAGMAVLVIMAAAVFIHNGFCVLPCAEKKENEENKNQNV